MRYSNRAGLAGLLILQCFACKVSLPQALRLGVILVGGHRVADVLATVLSYDLGVGEAGAVERFAHCSTTGSKYKTALHELLRCNFKGAPSGATDLLRP